MKFEAARCEHCTQTKEVLYPIDLGSADIVKAISVAIQNKGINIVHVRKELEVKTSDWSYARMLTTGAVTSSMTQNIIRPKKHGLIAPVRGKPGNWCLTTKGSNFLHGAEIPKYAIQDKITKHLKGYWMPEVHTITIHKLGRKGEAYWEAPTFRIVEGEVITENPIKQNGATMPLL